MSRFSDCICPTCGSKGYMPVKFMFAGWASWSTCAYCWLDYPDWI